MPHTLTKAAKKTLATIYKTYLTRKKSGSSKRSAVFFDASSADYKAMQPELDECAQELKSANYIKTFITGDFELTDAGIVFMENLPADTIREWLTLVAQFI